VLRVKRCWTHNDDRIHQPVRWKVHFGVSGLPNAGIDFVYTVEGDPQLRIFGSSVRRKRIMGSAAAGRRSRVRESSVWPRWHDDSSHSIQLRNHPYMLPGSRKSARLRDVLSRMLNREGMGTDPERVDSE
jgi:hypothetical protein